MTTPITTQLANVRVHGLGLTDDFLLTLSDRAQTAKVDGATPASYDLPPKMPLEEAILDAWDDARKAWTRSEQYHTDPCRGNLRRGVKEAVQQSTPVLIVPADTFSIFRDPVRALANLAPSAQVIGPLALTLIGLFFCQSRAEVILGVQTSLLSLFGDRKSVV